MLGACDIRGSAGVALAQPGRKAIALLAYLCLAPGQRAPREKLADLLWPDRPSTQARNSLRQTISLIRKLPIGQEDLLLSDRDHVGLAPGGLCCDVVSLIELCEGQKSDAGDQISSLYQGPFMDGFFSGSPIFDDWAAATRGRIETVAVPTLHEAARTCPPEKGLTLLRKLLNIDPTREATYQLGMELYAVRRQRDQALRLFESMKAMLAREYGVGPSHESERIRQRILDSLPFERSESTAIIGARGSKMTVRVRPFENLSATTGLDGFLKGLLEATVIELSRINEITVLQDGQPSDPADVVLSGSLLAGGSQMQLITRVTDGATGRHLSGERFRISLDDQVSALEGIAECVALATRFECLHHRWQLRDLTPVDDFSVRLLVLKAHCRYYELTAPSLRDAIRLAEQALETDPKSLRAQRVLSLALTGAMVQGVIARDTVTVRRAIELARGVAQAVPEDVFTRCVLAWALGNDAQHEAAVEELRYAIQLNPRYSTLHSDLAEHYALMGYISEALSEVEEAIRLSDEDVVSYWRYHTAAVAQFAAGNYTAALHNARRAMRAKPGLLRGAVYLAASAAALGLDDEATRAVDRIKREHPDLTLQNLTPGLVPRFVHDIHHQQLMTHLRAAGLT